MSTRQPRDELLADRAIWGPEPGTSESTALAEGGDPSFDRVAAAITSAYLFDAEATAPQQLIRRIQAAAITHLAEAHRAPAAQAKYSATPATRRRPRIGRIGSLVAAAALLLAALWIADLLPIPLSPSAARQALIAADPAALRMDWTRGPSELSGDPSGDVLWSESQQRGFMRFSGLPANDPIRTRYQLWIFDRTRNATQPVDGGVFDIAPGTGESIIPIRAKLAVRQGFAFAVTVEEPGGVVVSERKHIVATAGL